MRWAGKHTSDRRLLSFDIWVPPKAGHPNASMNPPAFKEAVVKFLKK